MHPGRGHTGGDLVLRVPDVDVLLAGDLVEESAARDRVPGFGDDCYPLEWPHTLDIVLSLMHLRTVVVPGHGAPVDREFVEEQRNAIGIVAQTIRDLAARGVPVDDALGAADWPFDPREELAHAVRRGYEHLPRSQRGCRSSEACGTRWVPSAHEQLRVREPTNEASEGISDDQLPEDLQPSDDNPLAEPLAEDEADADDLDELDMLRRQARRGRRRGDSRTDLTARPDRDRPAPAA